MSIKAQFHIRRNDFVMDVELNLPDKGVTALFGPSGCGKTSILRAMAGLDHYPNGALSVGDTVWQSANLFVPPHERSLGFVFQEASLFPHLTVRGNLDFAYKRAPIENRRLGIEQVIDFLELKDLLPRKPDTLSGGEKQRVAIGRALAANPKLLMMDEPLVGLDHKRKEEVLPYMEALHTELDIPVVYVSHSIDEVAHLAHHLVLMERGSILASGDIHELFTRLDLPLARYNNAASIIEAVVGGHDEEFHLTRLDFAGGSFTIPIENMQIGARVRLQLAARDVSITMAHQSDTSILNIFPAVVDEISETSPSQVTVKLLAGHVPLLSHITRKSAATLGLQVGGMVYAQAKSVALLS
jgi:molybdate transport system ATP-binding protein